jgi:hypothetical protein
VIAWRVARSLKNRAENTAAIDEVAELDTDAAMRVALSTAIALRRHHPRPFDGSVQVIASEVRMSRGIADAWRAELTGSLEVIDAGERHTEALNPSNPRFRAAMATALDNAAQSIAADQTPVESVVADSPAMQEISAG